MFQQSFVNIYTKFKMHFYQKVFERFQDREATLTTVETFCMEMIYALDKIAPGTANDDTLLYGVEVKFYNMEVSIDNNLETRHKGLFVIGDCSGVTHSLSHASASGIYVARYIAENI